MVFIFHYAATWCIIIGRKMRYIVCGYTHSIVNVNIDVTMSVITAG